MQIFSRTNDEGAITIISVSGDVDVSGVPALRSAIDRSLLEGAQAVILDLGEVDSIDSIGMAVVSNFRSQCTRAEARWAVAAANADVRRFLTDADTNAVSVHSSVDAARASLRANVR